MERFLNHIIQRKMGGVYVATCLRCGFCCGSPDLELLRSVIAGHDCDAQRKESAAD